MPFYCEHTKWRTQGQRAHILSESSSHPYCQVPEGITAWASNPKQDTSSILQQICTVLWGYQKPYTPFPNPAKSPLQSQGITSSHPAVSLPHHHLCVPLSAGWTAFPTHLGSNTHILDAENPTQKDDSSSICPKITTYIISSYNNSLLHNKGTSTENVEDNTSKMLEVPSQMNTTCSLLPCSMIFLKPWPGSRLPKPFHSCLKPRIGQNAAVWAETERIMPHPYRRETDCHPCLYIPLLSTKLTFSLTREE